MSRGLQHGNDASPNGALSQLLSPTFHRGMPYARIVPRVFYRRSRNFGCPGRPQKAHRCRNESGSAPDPSARDEKQKARAAAKRAKLHYVDDSTAGFRREKHGRSFRYIGSSGRPITDRRILERIRGLVIPPAWTDVWICRDPNGHLQVTGHDAKGRKQYRYHPRWREVRDENKYDRLISFAEALPRIRRRVARDFAENACVGKKSSPRSSNCWRRRSSGLATMNMPRPTSRSG